MGFLRNRWYVAGWSTELAVGRALGRRILDEPIAIWRTADGRPVAIGGRCPHRFAPLADGAVHDDHLRCPYHGLEFDVRGQCVVNPNGNRRIPPGARVPSYAIVERYGALWIWPGQGKPDEGLVPNLAYTRDPTRGCARDYLHVRGNYGLVIDNLMDLTHALYLHPGTLVSVEMGEVLTQAVRQIGDHVEYSLAALDVPPPALHAAFLPKPAARIDFFTDMHWEPASYLRLTTRVRPAGVEDPAAGAQGISAHLITPETDSTAHYFFAATRDRRLTDAEYTKWRGAIRFAFEHEDEPMIQAQQQMMGTSDLLSLRPALLSTDAGPMRVRRILSKLIREEKPRNECRVSTVDT